MRSIAFLIFAALMLCLFCPLRPARAATAEQVQNAIDRATKYIYSQMHDDNWEIAPGRDAKTIGPSVKGGQWGGITAISTYALLAAGESPQDPRIAKAINFLLNADLVGTYAIGLRSQVWLNIPKNDRIREAIAKDAKLMLLSARTVGPNKGEFTYVNGGPKGSSDHSNSQYGVLGLWADSDSVEGIPDEFWANVDESWRSEQGDDGSWAYPSAKPGTVDAKGIPIKGTPTMTAAGLATLFITQDFLYRGRGLECTGNIVDKNIDAGLKWMATNFRPAGTGSLYGMYGVERIGVASGYKYFGDIDWYERGADAMIKGQNPKDGSFAVPADPKNLDTMASVVNTCFALLFLSRGRAPVMMNKLQYQVAGAEANWNERPRDAYNIARYVGKETENTLNWQITSISKPADEWHDAPILYIAGNQVLNFTPAEIVKLKTFVDQGGLILGSADCGRKPFSDSFRALGKKLFADYEFKALPVTDIIMHDEQFNAAKWRRKPTVLAMDNGARKLMILIPDADPAKAWQMQETVGKEELFQLAANIFLYAVDKQNMFFKGDTYIVEPNPAVRALKTIDVARLSYDGNWNPEPGGWWRLSAFMHNSDSLDVTVSNSLLPPSPRCRNLSRAVER
jgi:hypothetical protein